MANKKKFEINAMTLGESISQIESIMDFKLVENVEQGKYWIIESKDDEINKTWVDIHFVIRNKHGSRFMCPKWDRAAVIPEGAFVHIGPLVC